MASDTEKILKHIDEKTEETQRHFEIVAKNIEDKIKLVAEQVAQNSENITVIKEDVSTLKKISRL